MTNENATRFNFNTKYLLLFILSIIIFYIIGMLFCMYIIAPIIKYFYMEYIENFIIGFLTDAGKEQFYNSNPNAYSNFIYRTSYIMGGIFEIPVLYIYLHKIIKQYPRIMIAFRIFFFFIFWIISGLITISADIITQAIVVVFFIIIAELLIQLSKFILKYIIE